MTLNINLENNLVRRFLYLIKKKFVKDVATLQVGSFFSTGLALLGSIIYARVLGVEGYATYALIFAFVSLLTIFSNVGTHQGTLTILAEAYTKQDRKKILDVLTYYVKITLLVSGLIGLIIIGIAPFLTTKLYSSQEIGNLARVIVLGDIIKIFFGMYTIVLQVARRIKRLTIVENLNKALYVIIPASAVLLGLGLKGLVFGYLITAFSFAIFALFAYRILRRKEPLFPAWKEIFANFGKVELGYYFKFGFLIAVDKNLASLYSILPIFILGIFHLEQVAFLKIAIAYAGLPAIFIGSSVSRLLAVQLPKSKSYSFKILRRDYLRSSIGSFLITSLVTIGFILVAFLLIPLVYGQEYIPAVSLAYPLLVGAIISSLGVGIGPLFRTLNLMKKAIQINFFGVIIGSLILYYATKNYPIEVSIYPIAFWSAIITIIFFVYLVKKLNSKAKEENNYEQI